MSGSFKATGMDTWDKSFPIFLHRRFHKDKPSVSGFGQGSLVLRPVIFLVSPTPSQSKTEQKWSWKTFFELIINILGMFKQAKYCHLISSQKIENIQ